MLARSSTYTITTKGRAVLRGPVAWALSSHSRDLLALCDPQVSLVQARQFLPPESLQAALFSLRELGLIDGPAVKPPAWGGWSSAAADAVVARASTTLP